MSSLTSLEYLFLRAWLWFWGIALVIMFIYTIASEGHP